MRNRFYILCILFWLGCRQHEDFNNKKEEKVTVTSYPPLSAQRKAAFTNAVLSMYDSLLVKRGFNGGIIVAKNGQILLEDYRGYANLQSKDTITPTTPFHVASVTKTFTGMAIMKLWEENKLRLDDSLQVFFPDFPYQGITVQMLLNHRSGLPNYAYAMTKDEAWKKRLASNQDMLRFLIEKKPQPYSFPNRGFNYCNTNYALLALIIEKVSGQTDPIALSALRLEFSLHVNDNKVMA